MPLANHSPPTKHQVVLVTRKAVMQIHMPQRMTRAPCGPDMMDARLVVFCQWLLSYVHPPPPRLSLWTTIRPQFDDISFDDNTPTIRPQFDHILTTFRPAVLLPGTTPKKLACSSALPKITFWCSWASVKIFAYGAFKGVIPGLFRTWNPWCEEQKKEVCKVPILARHCRPRQD